MTGAVRGRQPRKPPRRSGAPRACGGGGVTVTCVRPAAAEVTAPVQTEAA